MKFKIPKIFKQKSTADKMLKAKAIQKRIENKIRESERAIWIKKLENLEVTLRNEHALEMYEQECAFELIKDQLASYEKRTKQLRSEEYNLKMRMKSTAFLSVRFLGKLEEFGSAVNKIVGEFGGLKDEAETHLTQIEK